MQTYILGPWGFHEGCETHPIQSDIVKSSMKSRGMRNEKRARWVPGKKDKRVLSKKGGRAER
jgi:hypothetical protein